jgi:hypothetical protein
MTEKQLKFSFVVDDSSFRRVKQALNEITTAAAGFAKAMQGTGGGGGLFAGANVGKPPTAAGTVVAGAGGPQAKTQIGNVVLDNANAFKSMANLGTGAVKAMTDAVQAAVRAQSQEINTLRTNINSLGASWERMSQQAAAGGVNLSVPLGQLQTALIEKKEELAEAEEKLKKMHKALPEGAMEGPEKGPPRSAFSKWWSSPGKIGENGIQGPQQYLGGAIQGATPGGDIKGWLRVGGMIAAGVTAAVNESMGGTRMYSNIETARSNLVNPEIRRLRGGDISGMLARQDLLRDPGRRQDLADQTGTGAFFEQGLKGGMGLVSSPIKSTLGTGGGGSMTEGLADTDIGQAQNAQNQVRNYENSTEFLSKKLAFERFSSDMGSRVATGRILGLGLNFKKGRAGLGGLPGMGGMGLRTEMEDTYGLTAAKLHGQGYDIGQLAGATQQSRALGMGGRGADAIMRASAMGWGQYGEVLAGAARGTAGRAGVPASAMNLANTALGGGINTAAGMQLGQTAFGFDPRGTTSGVGLMSAIQGGFGMTGGIADMNTVARIQGGMAAGDKLAGGFDAYQQGRNLVSAISTNPGGSTYSQDYLANGMSFKQMLDAAKHDMTGTGKSLGLTSDMVKKQLGSMGSSVFDRFVDQGGTDPMSSAIREFRKSGMELPDFMAGLKKQKGGRDKAMALGDFMGMEMGVGEEGGRGLAGLFSGMDFDPKNLKKGKGPSGAIGAGEQAQLGAVAGEIRKDALQLGEMGHQLIESFGKLPDEVKKLTAFGTDMSMAADTFVKSLNGLAMAINQTTDNIKSGKNGFTPASSQTKATAPATTINEGPSVRFGPLGSSR